MTSSSAPALVAPPAAPAVVAPPAAAVDFDDAKTVAHYQASYHMAEWQETLKADVRAELDELSEWARSHVQAVHEAWVAVSAAREVKQQQAVAQAEALTSAPLPSSKAKGDPQLQALIEKAERETRSCSPRGGDK